MLFEITNDDVYVSFTQAFSVAWLGEYVPLGLYLFVV